jgi:hypothetical protein
MQYKRTFGQFGEMPQLIDIGYDAIILSLMSFVTIRDAGVMVLICSDLSSGFDSVGI